MPAGRGAGFLDEIVFGKWRPVTVVVVFLLATFSVVVGFLTSGHHALTTLNQAERRYAHTPSDHVAIAAARSSVVATFEGNALVMATYAVSVGSLVGASLTVRSRSHPAAGNASELALLRQQVAELRVEVRGSDRSRPPEGK